MRKLRLREIVAQGHSGPRISTQTPWCPFHWTGSPRKEEVVKGAGMGR